MPNECPALRPPAWADHIATLRGYIDVLPDIAYQKSARKALDAIEAELQCLRDDPNRLDFTGAPSVFVWQLFGLADGNIMAKVGIHGKETEAISDTPRAALAAAIKRLKL